METKFKRGGAPKKAEEEKRDRRVEVGFTPEEYNQLVKRKASTRLPNLGAFIRSVCLDKPIRMKPQLSTHQENVLSLLREMRADILRIGINVNQSVRRINNTTDYQNLQHEVAIMAEQVARFDKELASLMLTMEEANQPKEVAYGSPDQ
jgi:hypothetical protein